MVNVTEHQSRAAVAAASGMATQAVRFAIVGVLNTGTTLLVIALLRQGAGVPVWLASGVGYAIGTIQSYLLNRWWTFVGRGGDSSSGAQFLRFVAVNVVLAVLFSGLNEMLARRFVLMVATLLTLAVVVPISFVAMRFFVFSGRRA